ncbi:MAG: aldo/keto reductase [Acidobacteriia bacterium]|nr:aldo/keto reductase [Terriglobia bacterium]
MEYTRLGNTGLIVSRLCLGAMTFGKDPSMPTVFKVEREVAKTMVETAFDAGINFFDTADAYSGGQSETMLGEFIADRRHDVLIATKVGFRTGTPITQAGLSRGHILASCGRSLKRLRTDYIDLYIVHKEDPFTPMEETLGALNDLVRQGKVRYIGFSNWPAWKAATALQMQRAHGWAEFSSGQMYYSLVGRDIEHEMLPLMRFAGLGMTVWSPLAGGFLSGKYSRDNPKDSSDRLASFDFLPTDKELGFTVVEKLREISKKHRASVAQIALSWLLAKPVVSSIIVGTSTLDQLKDNLGASNLKLTGEDVAALDKLTAPMPLYPAWFSAKTLDAPQSSALGSCSGN